MINITNWAYYPNPNFTHEKNIRDLLNVDDFTIRLCLWKNFPNHERSIKKDHTEMSIDNVPIFYPTSRSKKHKTLFGVGYWHHPNTKVDIEIFNESYSLKDLKDNFHVKAEPSKHQNQKRNIFGFFQLGGENSQHSIRLYNADKTFIKNYHEHFASQETKFIYPDKNLGASGMEIKAQRITSDRFLIYYLNYYIFKGDKYKDSLPIFNKNYKSGRYMDKFLDYKYKIKIIKKNDK